MRVKEWSCTQTNKQTNTDTHSTSLLDVTVMACNNNDILACNANDASSFMALQMTKGSDADVAAALEAFDDAELCNGAGGGAGGRL